MVALGASGCGLGDIPTRAPRPTTTPVPTPTPFPTPTPPPTPTPTPSPKPTPTAFIYTVKAGDNLLNIAKRYKTTGRSIAYWNRATYPSLDPDSPKYDPNRIEVGWKLSIIPGVTIDDAVESPPGSSPTPEPTIALGPAETPPADGAGLLVTHGSRASNVVVLTFDLGGPPEPALPIVRWLVEQRGPGDVLRHGPARPDRSDRPGRPGPRSAPIATCSRSAPGPAAIPIRPRRRARRSSTSSAVPSRRSPRPRARPRSRSSGRRMAPRTRRSGRPRRRLGSLHRAMGRRPDDSAPARGGPTADDIVTKVAARAQGGLDRPAAPRRGEHARGAARDRRRPGRRGPPAGHPRRDAPALTAGNRRRSPGAILRRWIAPRSS